MRGSLYLLVVENAVVVPSRLLKFKRSIAGASAVLFGVLSWKIILHLPELVPLSGEKCQATPTKQDLGTSWFLSKFLSELFHTFYRLSILRTLSEEIQCKNSIEDASVSHLSFKCILTTQSTSFQITTKLQL